MALSNKFGWLVIATGNKSELSVGYSTLYGDLAGGFALIKDVYKTDVFRLSRRLNERAGRELIPLSIIERPPSAELRADQLDEDSLPPYPKLDRVLEAYVELDRSREELSQDGFDPDVVDRAVAMIDRAEYKRRQAPPGVKLRPKAFGRDRRTPITNRWRELSAANGSGYDEARASTTPRIGTRHRQRVARSSRRRRGAAASAARRPSRISRLEPRAEHEVVEVRDDEQAGEERDLHPEDDLERRAAVLQSSRGEHDAGERRDEQRAVAERPPAEAERLHRAPARLALERCGSPARRRRRARSSRRTRCPRRAGGR